MRSSSAEAPVAKAEQTPPVTTFPSAIYFYQK